MQLPYRVLNAGAYGVPQDRRRLFLLVTRHGQVPPDYPAPSPRVTVQVAMGDLPDADLFDELLGSDHVAATLGRRSLYARKLRGEAADPDDLSHPRRWNPRLRKASTRTAHTELSRA